MANTTSDLVPDLPPELDAAGKYAMREKARDHLLRNTEAFGHMSDEWIADRVRMLTRNEIWHEAICSAARDRIMRLSLRVEAVEKAALEGFTAGTPAEPAYPRCACGAYEWGPSTTRITDVHGQEHYREKCATQVKTGDEGNG